MRLKKTSFATGGKKLEPASTQFTGGFMRAHFVSRAKIINMADETQESCSFHEMGLDDRLVKVSIILTVEIKQNSSVLSSCLFLFCFIRRLLS